VERHYVVSEIKKDRALSRAGEGLGVDLKGALVGGIA